MKRTSSQWGRAASLGGGVLRSLFMASLLLIAGTAWAQTVQQRLDAVSAHLKQLQSLSARLPADSKAKLSSGAQHLLRAAARLDELQQVLTHSGTLNAPLNGQPFNPSGTLPRGAVSDPSTDLAFSRMAAFVQSETAVTPNT